MCGPQEDPMREIAKTLKIQYNAAYYSLLKTEQTGSNQNRKRNGRPQCTTEKEDKYIRVSSLRNRRLTSPQLAASLNSTHKKICIFNIRPNKLFVERCRLIAECKMGLGQINRRGKLLRE
jgi:hypothetical protein